MSRDFKKAKYLAIVWVASIFVISIVSKFLLFHFEIYTLEPLSAAWFVFICVVVFYILPLLLTIRYYARKAQIRWLYIASTVIRTIIFVWLGGNVLIALFGMS